MSINLNWPIIIAVILISIFSGILVLWNALLAVSLWGFIILYILLRQKAEIMILVFWVAYTVQYLYEFSRSYLQIGDSKLYFLDIFALMMFFVAMEKIIRDFSLYHRTLKISLPAICFGIIYFLGMYSFIRGIPEFGRYAFGEFRMIFYSVFYIFIIEKTTNTSNLRRTIRIVTLTALILPIFAVYNILTDASASKVLLMGRAVHHEQALYALFGLVSIWAFRGYIIKSPIFRLAAGALFFFVIAVSTVRSVWITAAAIFPLIFLISKDHLKFIKASLVIILGVIVILVSQFAFFSRGFPSDIQKSPNQQFLDLSKGRAGDTAKFRLDAWGQTIENRVKPYLFLGSPMGSYYEFESGGREFQRLASHNSYIDLTSKLGIIGLGAFVLLISYYLTLGISIRRKIKDPKLKETLTFCILAIAALLIFINFDSSFYSGNCGILVWLFLGFVHNIINRYKKEKELILFSLRAKRLKQI